MTEGIAHIAFTVQNMDRSLAFYCDKLGFKYGFQVQDDNGNPWIEYVQTAPQQFIELFYGGEVERPDEPKTIGMHHICFRVNDIRETANQLRDQGIMLDVEPKRGVGQNWQCWISDPDGNKIEFIQPDDDSPHLRP
ncbi:VOC family protein [Salisediminibacterium halotolerans]|uniref:Lactoylglutathione lyase n=1 Tax=Salisediminibacterium halotolerans TaxID=517425 RepID=A0A1H9SHM2_9BACI|nr:MULTISPECIES: VOC family protein [Salisediminibacterium]RLJ73220.1 lactoylglutathione lyase [Actinophytocola xinjiangensis]RPE86642.1 lactoylglutathione lyase [Salisediminibacterium halotolerans]TWG34017.1 lactoylglutathione lyase [Salisediminibacterium halotolerans]SER84556.1 lactoylglutathione lyase [Salisediminibacterium haloalkalitolerans]GEL09083.1 VOC family protein [Salisediminibacterium halotolerans]